MGPAPRPKGEPVKWKSLLSLDGTPIEYSWKWNTRTSDPDIRYVTEPIGQFLGSELDPLNQHALREELQRLAQAIPENNMNLSWVNHFFAKLYDHDYSKYTQAAAAGSRMSTATSVQLGVEFLRKGTGFKTYLFPRKLGLVDAVLTAQYETAISQLDTNGIDYSARAALHEFLNSSPEGKLLNPFSIAVDNVAPEKSRLKWYFHTLNTSFKSVREVMTLGGRITGIEKQLEDLYELVKATAGLPADFPEDQEVPLPKSSQVCYSSAKENFGELDKVLTGYLYYFDIAPGNKFPEIKWFIPVRHYGPDDLALAHAIMGWMEKRNRGAFCKGYLHMLEVLAEHRRLDEGKGLQSFVSCLFKSNGELDITTYLGAEAFHPARLRKSTRGTIRRGEW
jgi:DMATS type aromatic prenyltransferase